MPENSAKRGDMELLKMSNMASYRTFSSRMGGGPDHSPARFAGAALSLLGLGPLSPQPAPKVLSLADPSGVRAVSPRPAAAPSRPTSRIRPEEPTRGSGVSSLPGPTMTASPGCRRYRWTSPNTSRPWWGSRSFHGAAGGARSIPTGYVRQSEHRLCEPHFQPSEPPAAARTSDPIGGGKTHE